MHNSTYNLLCTHLKSSGHKNASEIASFLRKLESRNGRDFALSYVKNIGEAIRATLLTGKKVLPTGIRTDRYIMPNGSRVKRCAIKWVDNSLNAALHVHRMGYPLDSQIVKKILALVNMKHVYKFDEPTAKHIEKFNKAVEIRTFKEWSDGILPDVLSKHRTRKSIREASLKEVPIVSLYSYRHNDKKSPVFDTGKMVTRKSLDPRSRDVAPLIAWLVKGNMNLQLTLLPKIRDLLHYKCNLGIGYLHDKVQKYFIKNEITDSTFGFPKHMIRGKISHIMESGGKDRAIAQPFLPYQALFEPLKKVLHNMCKNDRFIHTDDQEKGVAIAQTALANGNTLYCYDASSFTDSFPLEYQLFVLDEYGLYDWSKLLKSFMDGGFYDPIQNRTVKYIQGQPMGLGPSFHLATLAHSDLVYNIYRNIYGDGTKERLKTNPYGVVGDDIFISDETVALAYRSIMERWGVTINDTKSVISNKYGEFCGVIFDKNSSVPAFKPKRHKWQFDQLASAVRYYGRNYLEFLRKDSKDLAIFASRLITENGFKTRLDTVSYLKLLKHDIDQFALNADQIANNQTLPHYEFLLDFISRSVNVNHSSGFHTSRYTRDGINLCKIKRTLLRHPNKWDQFKDHFDLLLKKNTLYTLSDDVSSLIELEATIQSEDDIITFTELYKDVISQWEMTFKALESKIPVAPIDPRKPTKVNIHDIYVDSLERAEIIKNNDAVTITVLEQTAKTADGPKFSSSFKPKRKFSKPSYTGFDPFGS